MSALMTSVPGAPSSSLTEEIAISAGSLKNRGVEGIADAIILATARAGWHRVMTGDPHFRDIRDAVFPGQP